MPTPQVTLDKMLDMARLTPQDVVVDLGSGDGRTVIAAAKRGARARGIEFNPSLVEQSKRNAAEAGVADAVTFTEGNMFEADISDATVLPLFLLPENLDQLVPKFLALRPGTRIVNNGFEFSGWDYDEIGHLAGPACGHWCVAYLYIVPARVVGRLADQSRRAGAEAGIPVAHGHADRPRPAHPDRARPAPGRRDPLQCGRDALHRPRDRRYDCRPDRGRSDAAVEREAVALVTPPHPEEPA